jgi:hypothetical protein
MLCVGLETPVRSLREQMCKNWLQWLLQAVGAPQRPFALCALGAAVSHPVAVRLWRGKLMVPCKAAGHEGATMNL